MENELKKYAISSIQKNYVDMSMESNKIKYVELTGGHCFICHNDFNYTNHFCTGSATPCNASCSTQHKKIPSNNFSFCPHCGHEL
jgi:hypothetical protein